MNTETIQARAARLVQNEVLCCVSSLVSTLAQGCDFTDRANDAGRQLQSVCEQAFELACPLIDYEEAAREAGWEETSDGSDGGQHVFTDTNDGQTWCARDWQELCSDASIDTDGFEREVFEHWAVSAWLAEKLIEKGEKVDKDFAGLNVWARTTTGQAISIDWVIEAIARELLA